MAEPVNEYERHRIEKIAHKNALLRQLKLPTVDETTKSLQRTPKRQKLNPTTTTIAPPERTSARLAAKPTRMTYTFKASIKADPAPRRSTRSKAHQDTPQSPQSSQSSTFEDIESPGTVANNSRWSSWKPRGKAPARDHTGTFHFPGFPEFTPNLSPEEVFRQGAFGGTYWRPLKSAYLKKMIVDDWQELPAEWFTGLNADTYLTSMSYDPSMNKYGVQCGQTIEEWEANGWIVHKFDVRGWVQWYCRFFMGRRCADDARQVARWAKCAGPRGRWRKALLKTYVAHGIRTVADEGVDGDVEGVSPKIHQTLHHWAFEVRQDVLEKYWEDSLY